MAYVKKQEAQKEYQKYLRIFRSNAETLKKRGGTLLDKPRDFDDFWGMLTGLRESVKEGTISTNNEAKFLADRDSFVKSEKQAKLIQRAAKIAGFDYDIADIRSKNFVQLGDNGKWYDISPNEGNTDIVGGKGAKFWSFLREEYKRLKDLNGGSGKMASYLISQIYFGSN